MGPSCRPWQNRPSVERLWSASAACSSAMPITPLSFLFPLPGCRFCVSTQGRTQGRRPSSHFLMRICGFVAGHERQGLKAHVLTDWVSRSDRTATRALCSSCSSLTPSRLLHSCLELGTIKCRTDGQEYRQFLHVRDVAVALGLMMERFEEMEQVTDISSNVWYRLEEVC